jgi:hypothetical protein
MIPKVSICPMDIFMPLQQEDFFVNFKLETGLEIEKAQIKKDSDFYLSP